MPRTSFAIRLPLEDREHLGPVRTLSGLEACVVDEWLWLRLDATELPLPLRSLRRGTVFHVHDDGGLVAFGRQVPNGYLPDGPWQSLTARWKIEWPTAALAGTVPQPVIPHLVRSETVREPNLLQTRLSEWTTYALTAPEIRLVCWHFAVSRRSDDASEPKVLIRGTPLPPLSGWHLVEEQGIAVPCGWHWSPKVDCGVLRTVFRVTPPDFVLWTPDGHHERIAAEDFVRATRSAVRQSATESTPLFNDDQA